MSDTEDFGIDEDDTAFFAFATQIEAQHDEFAYSDRPSKRQRLSRSPNRQVDLQTSAIEHHLDTGRDALSASKRTRRYSKQIVEAGGSDEEDYYFDGELNRDDEEEKRARLAKYKIHIPKSVAPLKDLFLSQTQLDVDEDPAAIRGPIWKKPAAKPLPPLFNQVVRMTIAPSTDNTSTVPVTKVNNIASFVQRSGNVRNIQPALSALTVNNNPALRSSSNKENLGAMIDLADLPDDAFSSSFGEDLTNAPLVRDKPQAKGLRAPQNGLKQMTIFGKPATQTLTSSQAAKKRHNWPMTARDERPTHHKLDPKALEVWTYPTNLGTIRDYQYNIVSRSLFHNTLVALPTGLGKTFIAATVMLNYFHWTTNAQVIFMAPTKPLIAQQMEACYGIVGIPRRDTVLMTGETTPAIRAEEWQEKRVFFMTPQTVINDLKTGICDPKKVVLIVVDEAHKATGGYAYTEVVSFLRRFNESFRVLALTATPGSTVEAVQAVIDNLGIARVELRTESSLDIRQYTHEKQTDTQLFDYSEEQALIMDHFSKAIQPVLDKLSSQNAYWSRDPMALNNYGLQMARKKWASSDAGRKAPMPIKGMINSIFTTLTSLAHGLGLLKFHGIGPFFSKMRDFQKSLEDEQAKKKYTRQIVESDGFTRAMSLMRAWSNNVDFIGHPKMEYLREVIMNHFLDHGERQRSGTPPRATRVMIFSSFRDSTDEICRVLKRNEPVVRPHVFVGQAASKSSEGMDQKKQNAVIQDFKSGKYNTLVATSIGEEGLDIGDVDLIICYDASASPIRMLQRIGRTGRKRLGKVVLLLMRGKEENDYAKAQESYSFIQKTIADESKYNYKDDQNPRIIPKEYQPVVDKRIVDIPIENSQPIDLNERARRKKGKGKAKKPAKRFNMPDGVRTGFVKASVLDSDASADEDTTVLPRRRSATTKKKKPIDKALPDVASIPFLDDVLLNPAQERDHDHRYRSIAGDDSNTDIEPLIPWKQPDLLRLAAKTRYITSGRYTKLVNQTLTNIHDMDHEVVEHYESIHQPTTTELQYAVLARLVQTSTKGDDEESTIERTVASKTAPVKKTVNSRKTSATTSKTTAANTAPRRTINTKATAKRVSKQSKTITHAREYGSDAMEGTDSEPEPTPADMRLATQGIDLGSNDTSGEDEEEEMDSELEDFVVNSDAPIEMLSSSMPISQDIQPPRQRGRLQPRKNTSVGVMDLSSGNNDQDMMMTSDDEIDNDEGVEEQAPVKRLRRIIDDSDSDA